MSSNLKKVLITNEILFNSFGQIFVKKRFVFNFVIKFFRYVSTKY